VIDDQHNKWIGAIRHGNTGKSDTGAGLSEVQQAFRAFNITDSLTNTITTQPSLMEEICSEPNIKQALKQVVRNKGAPGVDGMTVDELGEYWRDHQHEIIKQLKNGTYRPKEIKGVKIPKPGGKGERQLGIPTAVERVIQQAIAQVLTPLFDPTFSESSYGFRPKRSAHQALKAASRFVEDGREYVVDIDLEKFFDQVNHDILMSKLEKRIEDKILLKLIRTFLEVGILQDGMSTKRVVGTIQGSPLSPLLSNIMLDELDKELEKRGHTFCRYADDCNVYVRSEKAGLRVMASVTQFIEQRLQLTVNPSKSKVAKVNERKFLGYRLRRDGGLMVAPESLQRFKDKVRELTKRNRGRRLELVIEELNLALRGWAGYFRLAASKSVWIEQDAWIRRKLRCYRLKQRKQGKSIAKWLMGLKVGELEARQIASSGKGWWCLSKTPALHRGLNNAWFKEQKLLSLEEIVMELGKPRVKTAVCENARTVV
jgi:RNA-directed DNA polymerase